MRSIASLLQHPFYPPLSALDPHAPRPPSRLTRPVKKKPYIFCPPLFFARHRYMPPNAIFEALFPGTVYPAAIYDANQSGAPTFSLFFFFMAQNSPRRGRLTIQKTGSLNPRLLCILMRLSGASSGESTRKAEIFSGNVEW